MVGHIQALRAEQHWVPLFWALLPGSSSAPNVPAKDTVCCTPPVAFCSLLVAGHRGKAQSRSFLTEWKKP